MPATAPNLIAQTPPLREGGAFEPDQPLDSRRVEWNRAHWRSQDLLLLPRDRQVEENVRMLAGQQWGVWSRMLGKWVDIAAVLDDKERRWRQRPVFNRLLFWFMLTHARMTENPPVITFQPSTGDRLDRLLAEVYDPVFKILWSETAMLEVLDLLFAWLIPGGRAHLKSRVDPNIGDLIEARAPASLELETPGGPIRRELPDVPFAPDESGEFVPQVAYNPEAEDGWEVTGKAFREHEGGIVVDALSCLEVRGQWGAQVPWHRKRWHMHRCYLTPEEVYDAFGVECEPEVTGDEAGRIGELRRLLLGTGFFGATESEPHSFGSHDAEAAREYVEVFEGWYGPSKQVAGMEEDDENPGGRLLITTRSKCLRDGQRPARFKYTSGIRCFDFVNLPGRPSGTSPQEALNPIQRTYNRGWAQILEHRNLSTNPIKFVDTSTGLKDGDIGNAPGQIVYGTIPPHMRQPPIQHIAPPALGEDVYRVQDMARGELADLGQLEGAEGRPPTRDPSGELVKELRFNSDRFLGPPMRRAVTELSRMAEDWLAILPTIWDREKVLSWAGDDSVVRTISVEPHLFEQGRVNVTPDVESMLPEGRGERQARVFMLWQRGAFGDPASPEAIRHYLDQARFPHMDAAVRPGGIHRQTAETENGVLAQADQPPPPVLEWYDDPVHLEVHEQFMSSPEYLRLPVPVQQRFVDHRAEHQAAMISKFRTNLMRSTAAEAERTQAAGAIGQMRAQEEGRIAAATGGMAPGRGDLPNSRERVEGAPAGLDSRSRMTPGEGIPERRGA